MKFRKMILILIIAVLLLGMILIGFFYGKGKKENVGKSYMLYEVTQPEPLTFSGKVQVADKQVVSYDSSLGNITEIHAKEGSGVKTGDPLITYSSENNLNNLEEKRKMQEQYNTNLDNLKTELDAQYGERSNVNDWIVNIKQELQNTYAWDESTDKANRISELQLTLTEAQQALQSAETKISTLENSVQSYEDQLVSVEASMETLENTKQNVITANFDGIVKVNEKGRTDSSEPVVTVYSKKQIVSTSVTEYDIEKLKIDQSVTLSYVNQSKEVKGRVTTVDAIPESDTDNVGSYPVTITPEDPIPLGYSVQVKVPQEELRIPKDAVITEKDTKDGKKEGNYVFRYEKGKAIKTQITIEEQDNYSKVLSGLEDGDEILEDPAGIKDQMKVDVL